MKATPEQSERLHRFAHDLRNRLIGLQQVLVQLEQEPTSEDHNDLMFFGEQQYFKALREVELLLDDMGVERGMAEPVFSTIALAPLVNEHLELMQHRFLRKRQPLELDLEEDLNVRADPRIVGDLLAALFSNASKFSPNDSPITVTSYADEAEAVLEVRDLGTGLSEEDLDQVFVRFAMLSNSPTAGESQGRSTLARAYDWALAHHGSLKADSEGPGQGCVFTLRLPRA